MNNLYLSATLLIGTAMITSTALAKELEVTQKNKQFSQKTLSIQVGDAVNFKNEDPFVHNVLSLSDIKTFDLGTYAQGQSKKVIFDKPGTVEVECAIHPDMKLIIVVKK